MSWTTIAALLGAIVLIGNAGAIIYRWISPAMRVKSQVEEIAEDIVQIHKHEKNDLESIKHITEMNKIQCKAMLDMMNHMIDGNHVANMKKTRDAIQDLLIRF